jgi:hypothetical protein
MVVVQQLDGVTKADAWGAHRPLDHMRLSTSSVAGVSANAEE